MLAVGDRIDPPVAGTFTTAGATGTAITFPAAMPSTSYHLAVETTSNPAGGLGEIWTSAKTVNGCTLHNSGNAGITGTYHAVPY